MGGKYTSKIAVVPLWKCRSQTWIDALDGTWTQLSQLSRWKERGDDALPPDFRTESTTVRPRTTVLGQIGTRLETAGRVSVAAASLQRSRGEPRAGEACTCFCRDSTSGREEAENQHGGSQSCWW
jgi:hypothetical protein